MDCGEAGKAGLPRGLMKQRPTAPAMNSRQAPSTTIPTINAASLWKGLSSDGSPVVRVGISDELVLISVLKIKYTCILTYLSSSAYTLKFTVQHTSLIIFTVAIYWVDNIAMGMMCI